MSGFLTNVPVRPGPMRFVGHPRMPSPCSGSVLGQIERSVSIERRLLHRGDTLYAQGEPFRLVHVVNSGHLKLVTRETDGRERIARFRFKGDWAGLDGLLNGHYRCDAVCMETAEVWGMSYLQLLNACESNTTLLDQLLRSIANDLSTDNDQMMTLCSLPTHARVAQFLCHWVNALEMRQLRTDQITLQLSRQEIGAHLGMTLESVSRSLTLLEQRHLIEFVSKGRREIHIPDVDALIAFIQKKGGSTATDWMRDTVGEPT